MKNSIPNYLWAALWLALLPLTSSCESRPAPFSETPVLVADRFPGPSGEVDLHPGPDLVAFTWNGDFFEEDRFPAEFAGYLTAFATPMGFSGPDGQVFCEVTGESQLLLHDDATGVHEEVNLNLSATVYAVLKDGMVEYYFPCQYGVNLNTAFGSGDVLEFEWGFDPGNQFGLRATNADGGVTTILIDSPIIDEGFEDFFGPRFGEPFVENLPLSDPQAGTRLPNCSGSEVVASARGAAVDLVQCGQKLFLLVRGANGFPSCGDAVLLSETNCNFCIWKRFVYDPFSGTFETEIVVYADAQCSAKMQGTCSN